MSRVQTNRKSLFVPGLFSLDECKRILEFASRLQMSDATVWEKGKFLKNTKTRKNLTSFIPKDDSSSWIYERMDLLFYKAAKIWGFDVDGTEEEIKYLKYEKDDHFAQWHADIGPGYANRRKLSMSVLLNSVDEFSGGELEVFPVEENLENIKPLNAGDTIVFPSFRHHRVSPVTYGERHVLINWISGPELR